MARAKNISLGPEAQKRLDDLIVKARASSASEVVRNALRFYEFVIEEGAEGSEFFLKKKEGDLTKVKFMF
jgi:Arc/MetJ-type ribon-helix-helix transcriptional regulator